MVAEYCRQDDLQAMPEQWRMVRCGWCGSLYLDPRPDEASLPAAYATYYTHQPEGSEPDGKRASLQVRLVNGYLNWRFRMARDPALKLGAMLALAPPLRKKLDFYGRHIPRSMCAPGTRLLDVGCGSGAFLLRAREMGIQAFGCEPDPQAVEACRSQGLHVLQGDVFDLGLDDAGPFDIVTLNHVIEHVYRPRELLERVHALLKPGGILWIGLPNPDALGLSLFSQGWKGLHPPFHLIIPRQQVLSGWVRAAGFVGARLLCRGAQSPGLWRESAQIAAREKVARGRFPSMLVRVWGDLASTISPRRGEETILVARKREPQ